VDPNQDKQPPVNEDPVMPSFDTNTTKPEHESSPSEDTITEQPAVEPEPASTPAMSTAVSNEPEVAPPPSAPVAAIPAVTNPGHTLGIVSLVLSILGAGLIGLIIGIVGLKKSKKAGHGNGLALAGIIIGSLNVVVGLIIGAVILTAAMALVAQCADLGVGTHVLASGTTITCN